MSSTPGSPGAGRRPGVRDGGLGSFELVRPDEIRRAADRISGHVIRTPLLPSEPLGRESGRHVRLKLESLQQTGSFKVRGALNFLAGTRSERPRKGVVTFSSGNHGQAVALAARLHHLPAVIVMPVTVPAGKRRGAERLGASIVLEGTTSLERQARAEAIAVAEDFDLVPPFDHPLIIAGQGTCALEALEDWPELDTWIVPIGGGGLGAGSAVALRASRPGIQIVGVEPEGAASMRASIDAGQPVTLERTDTIADGLAPVRPGALTFHHVAELFDDVVTVPDSAILDATRFLLHTHKLVVEPSGAAALAGLREGALPEPGKRIVCVVSGGNLDPSLLGELL